MSDNKRSSSLDHDESIPASKKRKSSLHNATSNLPSDIFSGKFAFVNVREFKKEALISALSAFNKASDRFEFQARKSNKKLAVLEKVFSIQESWIQNVMDQLDVVLANNRPLTIPSSNAKDNFLLEIANQQSQNNGNDDLVLLKYKSKAKDIKNRIEKLLQWNGIANDSEEFRKQTSIAVQDIVNFEDEYKALKANTQKLETQLEEMTAKYLDAQKSISKLQSPVTTALFGNGKATESVEPNTKPAESGANSHSVPSNESAKEENPNDNEKEKEKETGVDSDEIKQLQLKLDQAKEVIEKQHQQLKDQDGHISSLNETIRQNNARLLHLTDSDLQHSHIHRSLRRKVDDLLYQLDKVDQLNAQFSRDKSNLLAGRADFQDKIRHDYDTRADELQARLGRADHDISRIRAARDEMLNSLNAKSAAEAERTKAFEQMKEAVASRETRINELEKEIEQIKKTLATPNTDADSDSNLDQHSIEELRSLVSKLKREKASLEKELPDLEAAFNSAHQKATSKLLDQMDREGKMNRLSVEKTKADEKYFQAMRFKDALNADYQKVKTQLSRNVEWITQLKDTERSNEKQIGVLENKLEDTKMKIDSLERDRRGLSSQCAESDRRGDSLRSLAERLESELKAKEKTIRNEADLRRQAEQEMAKLKKQLEVQSIGLSSSSVSLSNLYGAQNGLAGGSLSPNGHNGNGGSDLDMQVQELRSIAICSVCSKNWKNTAIRVCGHVFCEKCAVDRLTARLRKCPLCNKQYSHSDLLPIHL